MNIATLRQVLQRCLVPRPWYLRWLDPRLSRVVRRVREEHADQLESAVPVNHDLWDVLYLGDFYTLQMYLDNTVNVSSRGHVLATLAFAVFLLENWPPNSVVPEEDRLELLSCMLWTTMTVKQHLQRSLEPESRSPETPTREEEEEEESRSLLRDSWSS